MKIVSVFITLLLIAGYAMSEDIIELPEGMVQIPVGVFERSFYDSDKNKSRTYKVYVDAFYMDKYEVTNAQFAEFLNAVEYKSPTYFIVDEDKAWVDLCRNQGAVANIHYVDSEGQVRPDEPEHLGGYRYSLEEYRLPADYTGGKYVADPVYENQPVIAVTWYGAMAYAEWAGKRLPTDAEWERAKSTSFLGTKHKNNDMRSWCLDEYHKFIYTNSTYVRNPLIGSPSISHLLKNYTEGDLSKKRVTGQLRGTRGGYWAGSAFWRTTFRCVKDVKQPSKE